MQPGGVAALEELGLGSCLEGIDATPVRGYHIYWGDE
jgi:squalene monooxygenase